MEKKTNDEKVDEYMNVIFNCVMTSYMKGEPREFILKRVEKAVGCFQSNFNATKDFEWFKATTLKYALKILDDADDMAKRIIENARGLMN